MRVEKPPEWNDTEDSFLEGAWQISGSAEIAPDVYDLLPDIIGPYQSVRHFYSGAWQIAHWYPTLFLTTLLFSAHSIEWHCLAVQTRPYTRCTFDTIYYLVTFNSLLHHSGENWLDENIASSVKWLKYLPSLQVNICEDVSSISEEDAREDLEWNEVFQSFKLLLFGHSNILHRTTDPVHVLGSVTVSISLLQTKTSNFGDPLIVTIWIWNVQ
jgi:hypothetical protein